jgi:hypothetical protein
MRRFALLLLLASCESSDATYAAVSNQLGDGGATVYKVWYRTTLFTEPVTPGNDSPVHVVAPGGDVAYVLLVAEWDPNTGPKGPLVPAITPLVGVDKGDIARIVVAKDAIRTACTGTPTSGPLAQDEYDHIRLRIFPDETIRPYAEACPPP